MTEWSELLGPLADTPRENGSSAMFAAEAWLRETLTRIGLEVTPVEVMVQPYRLRVAGVVALLAGIVYAPLLKRGHFKSALALALLVPAALLLVLEGAVSLPDALSTPERHVVATIRPTDAVRERLVFTAHYDTKTDLFDHVERVPFEALLGPVVLLQALAAALAARRKTPGRLQTIARWAAVVQGLGTCLVFTGGLLRAPSPGALDDGGSCAVLMKLGEELLERPPLHTQVELAFLASEENGVQGSQQWVRQWKPSAVPVRVVNLEGLGSDERFAIFSGERFTLKTYQPDAELTQLIDAVHRQRHGTPAHRTWYPASTDARSFLAEGIAAATLTSDASDHGIARGLHSSRDDRRRLNVTALQEALDFLEALVRETDRDQ